MARKKKQEKTYQITFLGLLSLAIEEALTKGRTDMLAVSKDVQDNIELYLRRHYSDKGGYPAIVLTDDGFEFISVERK